MLHQLLARKPIEPAGHVDAGEPVEGSLEGEAAVLACLYLFWQPFVEHGRISSAGRCSGWWCTSAMAIATAACAPG